MMEQTKAERYGKKIIAALYLALLCVSLYFTLFGNSENREIIRARADKRSLIGAMDSYYVDNAQYPTVDEAVTEEVAEEVLPTVPEESVVLSNTYDPTNGIIVMGDVYRIKQ